MIAVIPKKSIYLDRSTQRDQLLSMLDRYLYPFHKTQHPASPQPIVGKRQGNRFELLRAAQFHNLFSPVAYGEFIETASGTRVEVELRLKKGTRWFLRIWFGLILLMLFFAVIQPGNTISMASLLTTFLGYTFVQFSFWSEVPKLTSILEQITATKPQDSSPEGS